MKRVTNAVASIAAALLIADAYIPRAEAQNAAAVEDWPGRQTIKIIVPFAAGTNADLMGRMVANYLGEALKATFVVENRVGAGGILGTRALAKSAPDGSTLCVCSGGAITVLSVTEKGYDPQVDLVPISRINAQPLVLIVKSSSSMKTVADVIEQSKNKSGGLSYGSSGAGGLLHNAAAVKRRRSSHTCRSAAGLMPWLH